MTAQEQRVALPALGNGTVVISTHLDWEGAVNRSADAHGDSLAELVLRGNEGVIVELPER